MEYSGIFLLLFVCLLSIYQFECNDEEEGRVSQSTVVSHHTVRSPLNVGTALGAAAAFFMAPFVGTMLLGPAMARVIAQVPGNLVTIFSSLFRVLSSRRRGFDGSGQKSVSRSLLDYGKAKVRSFIESGSAAEYFETFIKAISEYSKYEEPEAQE